MATARWVDWFNHRRLYQYCGDVPPVNSRLPTTLNARDQPPAEVSDQRVSGLTGAVHAALGGHLRIVAEFGENTVELTA